MGRSRSRSPAFRKSSPSPRRGAARSNSPPIRVKPSPSGFSFEQYELIRDRNDTMRPGVKRDIDLERKFVHFRCDQVNDWILGNNRHLNRLQLSSICSAVGAGVNERPGEARDPTVTPSMIHNKLQVRYFMLKCDSANAVASSKASSTWVVPSYLVKRLNHGFLVRPAALSKFL